MSEFPDPERPILAVDIGGTKFESAIMDRRGGLSARIRGTTGGGDGEELFARLVEGIRETLGRHRDVGGPDPLVTGVGCGGPMTVGGASVSPLNIPQWREFPLRANLADALAMDVFVDNDAKALALAEGWLGAARGASNYLAMVVSTGVGAGLVVDGHLLGGASGNAGHLGHVVVEPGGRECACGSRGCLEAEASGTAIAAITGRPAAEADAATRRRTGTMVGRAVAAAAVSCDLRLACVGGSVALGFGDEFFSAANVELARLATIDYVRGVQIVPVGLGADGPLVGAGCVARCWL